LALLLLLQVLGLFIITKVTVSELLHQTMTKPRT